MSFFYLLSKFTKEAIWVELFLMGVLLSGYFGYLLIQKRKYGAAKNQIPDNVVRAFLMELIANAEGFKHQLFGENFTIDPKLLQGMRASLVAAPVSAAGGGGADPALLQELQTKLQGAISKSDELQKLINQLNADKASMEEKLKNSPTGAAPVAGNDAELKDKIARLEAKLAEYEVIEDDLANLKRYQQENKELREQLQKGGAAPAPSAPAPKAEAVPAPAPAPEAAPAVEAAAPEAPAAAAPAPEETPAPTEAAAEPVSTAAEEAFEKTVDQVEQSLAPEASAPTEPAAPAEAAAPAPTPDAVPEVKKEAPAGATAAAPKDEAAPAAAPAALAADGAKSDADLLSEFEKMLNG